MPCPPVPKEITPINNEHTLKGCVHYIDFKAGDEKISSKKARPWIIIGRNNYKSKRITISPISDRKHYVEKDTDVLKYPYHAPLDKKDYPFLDKDSVVLLDQVYTISKDELFEEWYVGKVEDSGKIDEAIMYNFDLFNSIIEIYSKLIKGIESDYTKSYSRK